MKVLFLCMNLTGLHGSVLHILEYAKFFRNMKAEISFGGVFIGSRIKNISTRENIRLYQINEVPVDEEFDLVYSLHLFLFPYLLFKGLKYKHCIHALLSVNTPIEQLPPSCMYPYFDLITAISPEIVARYHEEFRINKNQFMIIGNPIPLDFMRYDKINVKPSNRILKVAVVSNHRLPELIEMAQIAPWQTDFFGMEYGNSVSITPELISEYDAIITIGKTVQYAMSLGIPVFEYDHFGGCGWITPENMEAESMTNFSGRSTYKKRDSKRLIKDIEEGYDNALSHVGHLREKALDKFSIIKLITQQLKVVFSQNSKRPYPLTGDAWFYCNTCYLAIEYILGLLNKNNA